MINTVVYTACYAGLLALLYIGLSFRVIAGRRKHKISYGDKNKEGKTIRELALAITVHNNAGQYIPIFLLLLFFVELQQFNAVLVNSVGIVFVIGRLLHAYGMTVTNFSLRKVGMLLTLLPIISLAGINIFWRVYSMAFLA